MYLNTFWIYIYINFFSHSFNVVLLIWLIYMFCWAEPHSRHISTCRQHFYGEQKIDGCVFSLGGYVKKKTFSIAAKSVVAVFAV